MFNRADDYVVESYEDLQNPHSIENFQTFEHRTQTQSSKPIRYIIIAIIVVALIVIPLIIVIVILSNQNSSPTRASEKTSSASTPIIASTSSSGSTSISTVTTTTSITGAPSTSITTRTTTDSLAQCNQYQIINDSSRLTTSPNGSVCDTNIFDSTLRWVRFLPPGGTQLTTTPTNWNTCGTMATGWINGSLPNSGITITATVCFTAFGNICHGNSAIQITNCGSYHVFGLYAPPYCNARYCTV